MTTKKIIGILRIVGLLSLLIIVAMSILNKLAYKDIFIALAMGSFLLIFIIYIVKYYVLNYLKGE